MADIPIRKKTGALPWWLWLLALLVLVAAVWFLVGPREAGDAGADLAAGEVERMEPAPLAPSADAVEITSLETLRTTANPAALVGRSVRIEGLRVAALSGDSTFFVATPEAPGDRILVVLRGLGESESGPGTGEDGRYDVDTTATTTVVGTVARLTPGQADAWALDADDRRDIVTDGLYIRADRLDLREE